MEEQVVVIYRTFLAGNRDAIALFPEIPCNDTLIQSYQHVGQHGGASLNLLLALTRRATAKETEVLSGELQQIGYTNLRPVLRVSAKMRRKRDEAWNHILQGEVK